jgi:hypothetical protein
MLLDSEPIIHLDAQVSKTILIERLLLFNSALYRSALYRPLLYRRAPPFSTAPMEYIITILLCHSRLR